MIISIEQLVVFGFILWAIIGIGEWISAGWKEMNAGQWIIYDSGCGEVACVDDPYAATNGWQFYTSHHAALMDLMDGGWDQDPDLHIMRARPATNASGGYEIQGYDEVWRTVHDGRLPQNKNTFREVRGS